MHIICLTPLEPGIYNDHSAEHIKSPPDGWAYIPDDFPLPSTFPRLGSIEAKEMTCTRDVEKRKEVTKTRETGSFDANGNAITEEYTEMETVTEKREYTMMTVTAMTEGTLPEQQELTPAEQREAAYNNEAIIEWGGKTMTVTQAAQQWAYYAAEGDADKTAALTDLIAAAKVDIRAQYPDEDVSL